MKSILAGLLLVVATSMGATVASGSAVGQLGGFTQAVAVQGRYAYVGVGLRTMVLDVSDPASPQEVGGSPPFSDSVRDIAVSGSIAYVAAGVAGLRVLDVTDPTHPTEIGSLQSRGYAEGVAVAGTTVLLANGPYGLRVIDVSNPRNPAEVGSVFTRNYAFKVTSDGRHAYVAGAGAGLLIADVSNPAQPAEVATVAMPGYAYGLAVSGNTAYVAGGWEGLLTIDVTSMNHPRLVGQIATAGWAFDVKVSGSKAFVAAGQGGLRVVDVSDPTNPAETGGLAAAGADAAGIAVAGTIAYLIDRNSGMKSIDLSTLATPAQVGSYAPMGSAAGVAVAGNYAYVAAELYGLRILDVSDPSHPRQVGSYDTQSSARSVSVSGNYAYVAAASIGPGQGLHVVDVSDPGRPVRAGFLYDGFGPYRNMVVANGIAYLPNEWGLGLFDVSNPAAPRKLSFVQTQTGLANAAVGVAVSDNLAYVAAGRGGIQVIDVSNPLVPLVIGRVTWSNALAEDVVIAQGKAFVADQSALTVLDLASPRAPIWLASVPTAGWAESLAVSGDQVFLANGATGLTVVDVTNPAAPNLAWSVNTQGYAKSVFVNGSLVYVADSSGGVAIVAKSGGAAASFAPMRQSRQIPAAKGSLQPPSPALRAIPKSRLAGRPLKAETQSSCVVTSTADTGAGTLRECLQTSTGNTRITFDVAVFPPGRPATITPLTGLSLPQSYITLDASNAGVILSGSRAPPATRGLVVGSTGNVVMGLQIVGFPDDGIALFNSVGTVIGGSRTRGSGPLGEGNLISGNSGNGISLNDTQVSNTTITGNLIGTDITGATTIANQGNGIIVIDSANNRIGGSSPDERNVVSGNSRIGIEVIGSGATGNRILGNYIGLDASGTKLLSNGWQAAGLERGASANLVQGNVISTSGPIGIVVNDTQGGSYNTIVGNLVGTDAGGTLATGSPQTGIFVSGGFNRIGGVNPSERNVVAQGGISFGRRGMPGNLIVGNFVGTDISGSIAMSNRGTGISVGYGSDRPFIGGTTPGERNVISGNSFGGITVGGGADYTFIGGNYIGTDASGQAALGNGFASGIEIKQGTHIFVQGNLIAHHKGYGGAGITLSGDTNNTFRQNLIFSNQAGGIAIQNGANNGVAPPNIASAGTTGISGTTCPGCEVEVFSDSGDQGQVFEGSALGNASGAFTFDKGSSWIGPKITATTTDLQGSSSRFSSSQSVVTMSQFNSQSDCVFSWAEKNHSSLFAPAGASNAAAPYYYRYYPGTNAYLATSSANNSLYYLGPLSGNAALDLGALSGWLLTATCQ